MFRSIAAIGLACFAMAASAASVDQQEFSEMQLEAQKHGAAPVSITLATYSIHSLTADRGSVERVAKERAALVLGALGEHALAHGRRASGIGSLDLFVTAEGLNRLRQTNFAVSFRRGKSWVQRIHGGADRRHEAIAEQLAAQGFADVVVALRSDDFDYELLADGTGRPRASAAQAAHASDRATGLLQNMTEAETAGSKQRGLGSARRLRDTASPELPLRVNLSGLLKLVESPEVRNIRPASFKDARRTSIEPAAHAEALSRGFANVVLTIRNPYDDAAASDAEHRAAMAANRRNMRSLLTDLGIATTLREFPEFASVLVRMTAREIAALQARNDPRLLSLTLDKPVAEGALSNSTPVQMRMGAAWADASLWGTGQTIVVMDSGVQSNHAMLRAPGKQTSRVTAEACFGTNGVSRGVNWRSNCSLDGGATFVATTAGPGTGAPVHRCQLEKGVQSHICAHGTHVASIAGSVPFMGITSSSPTRGVAHGASIAAYQVFSYDTARVEKPGAFASDLLAAMQRVLSLTKAGTTQNPWVINMSLGSGQHSRSCLGSNVVTGFSGDPISSAFAAAVATLKARGVPVIAATGNDKYSHSILWPACVPGVIKVASVINDATGSAISRYGDDKGSNLANPYHFPGETFWFAPGGGSSSPGGVSTSVMGAYFTAPNVNTETLGMVGTSMSTPHVSGIYAIVKGAVPGIAVDDIYPTLLNFGAVVDGPTFTVNDCNGQSSPSPVPCVDRQASYKMIRLP